MDNASSTPSTRINDMSVKGKKSGDLNKKNKGGKKKFKKIFFAVLVVLILSGITFGCLMIARMQTAAINIDESEYQAIFLTNGQVYFGKLHDFSKENYKLNDIFYLQTKTNTDSSNPQKTTASDSADVQLIKLGSEIHGPEDQMIINKEQVLFFENIKNDGKVAKSIQEYKK